MNYHKINQSGTVHLLILSVLIMVISGIAGVGIYVNKNAQNQSHNQLLAQQHVKKAAAQNHVNTVVDSKAAEIKPSVSPATSSVPKVMAKPVPANKRTTPSAAVPLNATPAPHTPQGTVTISSDGCSVTGTGPAGAHFKVSIMKASRNGGGDATYTLPASGRLTEFSGGYQNEYVSGQIINLDSSIIASLESTVTASSCPPGDPV